MRIGLRLSHPGGFSDPSSAGAPTAERQALLPDGGDARPAAGLGRRAAPPTTASTREDLDVKLAPSSPGWGRSRSARASGHRSRSYYVPDEVHFRLRNAWWHTRERQDQGSLSTLVASALRSLVEDLEVRFNEGRPFPEVGRRLPTGPPGSRRATERAGAPPARHARRSGSDGQRREHAHPAPGRAPSVAGESGPAPDGGEHGVTSGPRAAGVGSPQDADRIGADGHHQHPPEQSRPGARRREPDHRQPRQRLRRGDRARERDAHRPVQPPQAVSEQP